MAFLHASPPDRFVRLSKTVYLSDYLSGLSSLNTELKHTILELIGLPHPGSLIEMQLTADARDLAGARHLIDKVKIELNSSRLRLLNPPSREKLQHCLAQATVTCPVDWPIDVRGVYSAVRLSDLVGRVRVETTHGRITILNVESSVNARVRHGIIDYSGSRGSARLRAYWELNLRFTSLKYVGNMDGVAEGPVRVLIPKDFATPFEANIAKRAAFVCRTDIGSAIKCQHKAGRLIYRFGAGSPAIKLTSRNGPIVIDNTPAVDDAIRASSLP